MAKLVTCRCGHDVNTYVARGEVTHCEECGAAVGVRGDEPVVDTAPSVDVIRARGALAAVAVGGAPPVPASSPPVGDVPRRPVVDDRLFLVVFVATFAPGVFDWLTLEDGGRGIRMPFLVYAAVLCFSAALYTARRRGGAEECVVAAMRYGVGFVGATIAAGWAMSWLDGGLAPGDTGTVVGLGVVAVFVTALAGIVLGLLGAAYGRATN